MNQTQERVLAHIGEYMENKDQDIELALVCAQDIVNAWPKMTIRTISEMTKRIETLKQALEAANK
jgi:hypothetical protein